MAGMELSEFLLARIAEREAWAMREGTLRGYRDGEAGGPALDLGDCEAKRRIVGWHASVAERVDVVPGLEPRHNELGMVLRALALPYADHPDYDPEWKP